MKHHKTARRAKPVTRKPESSTQDDEFSIVDSGILVTIFAHTSVSMHALEQVRNFGPALDAKYKQYVDQNARQRRELLRRLGEWEHSRVRRRTRRQP